MLRVPFAAMLCLAPVLPLAAQQPKFTVRDALSAPFMNQLTAAPAKHRVAWFVDAEGRRNVWVASPTEKAHSITHYTEDDGQDIDDITWSPDAERVAYTHGTGPEGSEHPVAANPAHLQIEVKQQVEIATVAGEVRVVGEGHSPAFSTDGKTLFFLRKGQVWSADVTDAAKQPEQLIIAEGRQAMLRPSPDGTRLAFVSERGDHSFVGVFTFAAESREQGTRNSRGTLTYVDPGTGLDHDPVWSADSKRIAFVRESPVVNELDLRWMQSVPVPWSIRVADVSSGDGRQVWQADKGTGSLFHEMVAKNQLLWMKDGSLVFPWEKTGWQQLYALAPGAKQAKLLTPGDFEVDNVVSDGERIVYSSNQVTNDANDIDRKHLWSVSTADSKAIELTSGQSLETNPALLTNGAISMMRSGEYSPFVPVFLNKNEKAVKSCTGPDGDYRCVQAIHAFDVSIPSNFPGAQFQAPRMVIFSATDGLQIHGQLMLPKNAKSTDKLPTIVFFHGGSRRQMLLGYNPMQYYAQTYEMNQYLVSRGYAVLSVNYRSGIGYGMAFRQAPHYGVFGGTEYLDVEGAVKWLKAQPWCDIERIGAWGGSYGGYLTALALARDSADFTAGVDLHGVHDWSFEMDAWKPRGDIHYDPVAASKIAYAASPLADVDRWRSPVLLMQGDDDRNVLFSQTVRLAAELRARGVTVEEKIYPDEVHDFLLHRDWVDAFERAADFFDRRLKAK